MAPLPIQLKGAEIRMSGNVVAVSAHGIQIRTELQPPKAAAIWQGLGAKPDQVSVTIRGDVAGAELIRLGEGRFGMRVWIGPMWFETSIRNNYFEVLRRLETAAKEEQYAGV